jgi:Fur family ferric uptake transcriptional regulator/Fur family peroxide stress response transcriptional regulator
MTNYAKLLKNSGLKATFQRIHILENIESAGHSTIDEIYEKVVKIHPSLSLATVYKNIILMVENALLIEVPISGKKSKFELLKDEHIHLICMDCGEVIDKNHTSRMAIAFNTMTQQEKFTVQKQQINLYGVCLHCKKKIAS